MARNAFPSRGVRRHSGKTGHGRSLRPAGLVRARQRASSPEALLRFPQGMFAALRQALLGGRSRECFGMLLARRERTSDGREVFAVREAVLAGDEDVAASSMCQVRPSRDFVARVLARAQADPAVNAVVDVHTHPFSAGACFSATDDADEMRFGRWLRRFDRKLGYASLLLSAGAWEARVWRGGRAFQALVRTKTALESVPHALPPRPEAGSTTMPSRTALRPCVDAGRPINSALLPVSAGPGGIGPVMAEDLARPHFMRIGPIVASVLDLACLGSLAGGVRGDIGLPKADVAREHLLPVTPEAEDALPQGEDAGNAVADASAD